MTLNELVNETGATPQDIFRAVGSKGNYTQEDVDAVRQYMNDAPVAQTVVQEAPKKKGSGKRNVQSKTNKPEQPPEQPQPPRDGGAMNLMGQVGGLGLGASLVQKELATAMQFRKACFDAIRTGKLPEDENLKQMVLATIGPVIQGLQEDTESFFGFTDDSLQIGADSLTVDLEAIAETVMSGQINPFAPQQLALKAAE